MNEKFEKLYKEIVKDSGYLSSIEHLVVKEEWKSIVKMGKNAIPLLYEKLDKDPHWFLFPLIRELIDEDIVVPDEFLGRFDDVRNIFMNHLKNNYI